MDKSEDHELDTFREEWKFEIKKRPQVFRVGTNERVDGILSDVHVPGHNSECTGTISSSFELKDNRTTSEIPYLPCNDDILQKTHTASKKPKLVPVPCLITLDIPSYQVTQTNSCDNKNQDRLPSTIPVKQHDGYHGDHDLISLLIRDIDETTMVPFFDISLPREVCLKIFSHLNVDELCCCACVSKAWAPLANDELIWYNVHKKLGFRELGKSSQELTNWKGLVRDSVLRQRTVTKNWKERICQIQTLEYEKGGALVACQMYDDLLIAGYANGKTCLWNVESNWRHSLEPVPEVFEDLAKASVECVSVVGDICATGFTCGIVNVWHTNISIHPIYQYSLAKPAQHLLLAPCHEIPLLLTCSGSDVRVDNVREEDGQWAFSNSKTFDTQISFVQLLPDDSKTTFVMGMKEDVFMFNPRTDSLSELDKTAGTKITAVTSNSEYIAVGWAPFGFGVGTGFAAKVRLYETKTGRHLQSFLGHHGDITCLSLCSSDGLVTGSKDRRVHVYDMRAEQPQLSLRGHTSQVTTVQMDTWKVVSGAYDGTLKVWDMRMDHVLWETRTTHPVRLCRFDSNRLVTANIPVDKVPRESMWYADDLILHRRHRGSVHVYDFGGNSETGVVPEEMRSNYDDIAGYNYNINLVAPYDALTTEIN